SVSHTLTHSTTQAVPRDHLLSEPYTNTLHHTSCTKGPPAHSHTLTHGTTQAVLGTTCTVSHALTHCTTHAVPRDYLLSEPYTNTLHHTSLSHTLTHCTTQAVPRDHQHTDIH
ncbi:predicted protein, partial [Nematostella vectensis]